MLKKLLTPILIIFLPALANEGLDKNSLPAALKQLKASSPMKVRGKKVYSEIDSNPGPSDAAMLFDPAGASLKIISHSKALLYEPERILGLPNAGVSLNLDKQID